MGILFVFFVLPLATIIFSIVLQKLLKNPILVGLTVFAIFLIVSFVAFAETLATALIATIIYTIIAFITAYIVCIIDRIIRKFCRRRNHHNNRPTNEDEEGISDQDVICCRNENDNGNGNDNDEDNNNENGNSQNNLAISANLTPCSNNGRTGFVRGRYRRF